MPAMTSSNPPPARVALVTGAARRLGREIALGLARAGWDVAVHYHGSRLEAEQTAGEIRALGRRSAIFIADLADAAQTRGLLDEVFARLGPVPCLVNNAARFEFDDPATFEAATLDRHVGPNLAAPLLLARRLHERLADLDRPEPMPEPRGVVVNLLDQKLDNLNPDFLSYTLTKAGLLAATRMLAMAFAPRLRVVGVSPGITLESGGQSAESFAQAHRRTPLGHSSTPQDICRAVVFLADAPAITGIHLVVDGGQHLLSLPRDTMFL